MAIRDGRWKLLVAAEDEKAELYDLENDWAEKTDVAADNPEITQQLEKKLKDWKASLPKSPSPNALSKARQKL